MTEQTPTDAELLETFSGACDHGDRCHQGHSYSRAQGLRAVLAKFGNQPAGVGEPWGASVGDRVWVGKLPAHVPKLAEAEGLPIQWLYTTPQPTQAQAGAAPLTDEQIRAMLNKHPPEDVCGWSYRMGIDDAELHHGIKEGGQHAAN